MNEGVNMFQRHFANEIKRADELDRRLRFFEDQLVRELEWEETFATHLEFGDIPLETTTAYDINDLEVLSLVIYFKYTSSDGVHERLNLRNSRRNCTS